jgi:iron complex outermembrane receptor protein
MRMNRIRNQDHVRDLHAPPRLPPQRAVRSRRLARRHAGARPGAAARRAAAASDVETQEVVIRASADASAGGLKAPYAGGQVARGGRVGMLGSQDVMDTPFTITNYTSKLIQDQQAASIADVLQNDPAVRVARGFGNFQQAYMVRGLVDLLRRHLVQRPVRPAAAPVPGGGAGRARRGAARRERVPQRRGPGRQRPGRRGQRDAQARGQRAADRDHGGRRRRPGLRGRSTSAPLRRQKNLGLRVNVVHRDGDTAVDGEKDKLDAALLGADFHVGGLRVSADVGSQDNRITAATPNITCSAACPRARRLEADRPALVVLARARHLRHAARRSRPAAEPDGLGRGRLPRRPRGQPARAA